ncbi:unnamed protein product [Psylliodes chrysocephalus]|uniref:Uncharacterized protein n=1 Tax=Psylliodes chrysocephalus TaxID=3402493 RepID=A0A9P0D3H4_9CUCU|nr:unnamed protein product [Psylliodes chrysocephala]
MKVYAVALLICVALYAKSDAIPTFSISDSNVPEIRYELHAVQALSEAWVLYPNNPLSRAEAFSDLFQDFYPIENGWNVAGACVQFYTSKTRIFVDILAKDANGTNIIKIFN